MLSLICFALTRATSAMSLHEADVGPIWKMRWETAVHILALEAPLRRGDQIMIVLKDLMGLEGL